MTNTKEVGKGIAIAIFVLGLITLTIGASFLAALGWRAILGW